MNIRLASRHQRSRHQSCRSRSRRHLFETLEDRLPLAGDFIYYDYVEDGELRGGRIPIDATNPLHSNIARPTPLLAPVFESTKIVDNGPSENRIDIVIVGDGYTASELDQYHDQVNLVVQAFFNEAPLQQYASFFNVHRVDVISNESGVDNDFTLGVRKDTALDGAFFCGGTERLLCVDPNKTLEAASNAEDVDQVLVIVNSSKYGGAGYPSQNIGTLSGLSPASIEVALHEFGHSFADLADEYDYGGPTVYTGNELGPVNVSIYDSTEIAGRQTKWYNWLDEPNVDAFEGGNYSEQGVFRPTANSKMRSLDQPFEQINSEQFIIKGYEIVNPIDNATAPGNYTDLEVFFVETVDPTTQPLDIQWSIDGVPIPGATGKTLDSSTLGLPSGNYLLSVEVRDNTDMVRNEGIRDSLMTATRSWNVATVIRPAELLLEITEDSIDEVDGVSTVTLTRLHPINLSRPLTVTLHNSDPSELEVPATVIIPAGSTSVTFEVRGLTDDFVDGTQTVQIEATQRDYISSRDSIDVTDADIPMLTLQINRPSIRENGETSIATVTRNTDTSVVLDVSLSSSDIGEATVPTTVQIPVGSASASFVVTGVEDFLVDGTQLVQIEGSSGVFLPGSDGIEILNVDVPQLKLVIDRDVMSEFGGSAMATVTRNTLGTATVEIISNDTTEATAPETLTFLSDQLSASFPITAVDDAVVDGMQTVTFSASGFGAARADDSIDVTDEDVPQLTFQINSTSISESEGVVATVSRNTLDAITLAVFSLDVTEASVLPSLSFAENELSKTFLISGVRDSLADGSQQVAFMVFGGGMTLVTDAIEVTDVDIAKLTVVVDRPSIAENSGSAVVTVLRNSSTTSPLNVALFTNDPDELSIPQTLVIPVGRDRATFTIRGFQDLLVDGTQTATVGARAEGFVEGTALIDVTDVDVPMLSLHIDPQSLQEAGGVAIATVTRNTASVGDLSVSISTNDATEVSVPTSVLIPNGAVSVAFEIYAVQDNLVDGKKTTNVTASAANFESDTDSFDVLDDDVPILDLSVDHPMIAESGDDAVFTVTTSVPSDFDILVSLSLIGDAVLDSDYVASELELVIPAGDFSASLTISTINDLIDEVDESVMVEIASSSPGSMIGVAVAQTLIQDDDLPPTLVIPVETTIEANAVGGAERSSTDVIAFLQSVTATSNVGGTTTIVHDAPQVLPLGESSIRFTATDNQRNSTTQVAVVNVVDTTPPLLIAPPTLRIKSESPGGVDRNFPAIVAMLGSVSARDLVDVAPTTSHDAPEHFPLGDTLVTFTSEDAFGNISTKTTLVSVVDTTPPSLTVPEPIEVEANTVGGASVSLKVVEDFLAFAVSMDSVDGAPVITNDASDVLPLGENVVTFTATDASGNKTIATSTITVVDTVAPNLTLPTSITVEGDTVAGALATGDQATGVAITAMLLSASAMDTVDSSPSVTNNAPEFLPLGITVVEFTATDASGNVSSGSASIMVVDKTAPILTVGEAISVGGDTLGGAAVSNIAIFTAFSAVTASDTVDAVPVVTNNAPDVLPVGVTVVTFTATDASGNSATATLEVSVEDTTAPVFVLPADLIVEADFAGGVEKSGEEITALLASVIAKDLVDSDVTISNDAPDTFPLGTTRVTITATDASENSISTQLVVTVRDTVSPTLMLPEDLSIEADQIGGISRTQTDVAAWLASVVASDTVDSKPKIEHDAPEVFAVGETIVLYTATDQAGNEVTGSVTITVTDRVPPKLSLPDDITIEGNTIGGATLQSTGILTVITLDDAVDESPQLTHDAPDLFPLGETVVKITATDLSGNTATSSITVTVTDTTAPAFVLENDTLILEADSSSGVSAENDSVKELLSSVTTSDLVDASPTIAHNVPDTFPMGDTDVLFSFTDASGNISTASVTISVVDTTPPTLTVATPLTIEADTVGGASRSNSVITTLLSGATAVDLVDPSVVIANNAPETLLLGDTVITFTATDASGNFVTVTRTVSVADTTAPQLAVPTDLSITAVNAQGVVATNAAIMDFLSGASASDLATDELSITNNAPEIFPIGETIVTFSVVDASGNEQTATAMIFVAEPTSEPVAVVSLLAPSGETDPADLPLGAQPTSWASQRSIVREMVIDLKTPITSVSPSGLVLKNLGLDADGDTDEVIEISQDQLTLSEDGTQLRLRFGATQLPDGVYQLDLLEAITGGETFSVVGNAENRFYVLRGDWNGSGGVNVQDFATFAYWFGQTTDVAPRYVDINGSGGINVQDFSGFAANFGKSIRFPGASLPSSTAPIAEGELESTMRTLLNPQDVNGDGRVTPLDALVVINRLERDRNETDSAWNRFDVNRDGFVSAIDALVVVNRLSVVGANRVEALTAAIDSFFEKEDEVDDLIELLLRDRPSTL